MRPPPPPLFRSRLRLALSNCMRGPIWFSFLGLLFVLVALNNFQSETEIEKVDFLPSISAALGLVVAPAENFDPTQLPTTADVAIVKSDQLVSQFNSQSPTSSSLFPKLGAPVHYKLPTLCPNQTWFESYVRLHADMLAGIRPMRTVILVTGESFGLADRLVGVYTAFWLAFFSKRAIFLPAPAKGYMVRTCFVCIDSHLTLLANVACWF